jgi:hypothetical protein
LNSREAGCFQKKGVKTLFEVFILVICPSIPAFFIGEMIAWVAFLPPLHSWGQRNNFNRQRLAVYLGLLTLIIAMLAVTVLLAYSAIFTYDFVNIISPDRPGKTLLIQELWLRYITSPQSVFEAGCFSNNPAVCQEVENILQNSYLPSDTIYAVLLPGLIFSTLAAIICTFSTYRFLRITEETSNKNKTLKDQSLK